MALQLLGRGTYGHASPMGPNVSRLWLYKQPPPAQNSVMIYADGSVVERPTFSTLEIAAANVHTFIRGGTDYRCEPGSFEHTALTAAGYTFRMVYPDGSYAESYDTIY